MGGDKSTAPRGGLLDDGLSPSRLLEVTDRTGKPFAVAELLLRVSHHWAMHTGQIVFDVKARKPGAFEEQSMKTMEKR